MSILRRKCIGVSIAALAAFSLWIGILLTDRPGPYGLQVGMTRSEVGAIFDQTVGDHKYARSYRRSIKYRDNPRDNPVALTRRFEVRSFCLAKRETRVIYDQAGRIEQISGRWIVNFRASGNF